MNWFTAILQLVNANPKVLDIALKVIESLVDHLTKNPAQMTKLVDAAATRIAGGPVPPTTGVTMVSASLPGVSPSGFHGNT